MNKYDHNVLLEYHKLQKKNFTQVSQNSKIRALPFLQLNSCQIDLTLF